MTTNRTSRRIASRADARLRNCMTQSSRRRWRRESTIAANICRTGVGVTIAYGDADDHQRKGDQEGLGILECHTDYCFPGDVFDRLLVLVVIEMYTKMEKAVVVPSKGSTGRMVIEFINECGDKDHDVILKTDQEAAIKFLVDEVCV